MIPNSLVELDRAHLLHPSASPRLHERQGVTILRSGRGAYLTDLSGRELLDGFAGLWCVNAGYGIESVRACRGGADDAAAVRDWLLLLRQRAGHPPRGQAGRDRTAGG